MIVPLLLLALIMALFSRRIQERLRALLARRPDAVFAAPAVLSAIFLATAAYYGCFSGELAVLIASYTFLPTALTRWECDWHGATWMDLAVILMLWLPLEFSAGASLVRRPVQGVLHATAYGVAILLALILFLGLRRWHGMKYTLALTFADGRNALFGYGVSALVLIPLGLWIGFLGQPHWTRTSVAGAVWRAALTLFGTALPEEILFRSLIQNWFNQRWQAGWKAVVAGGLIFGAAHLNNGPGPLPNWRYLAVGVVAGLIFGTVFQRSNSVAASAVVHAGVDLTKHFFF